MPPSVVAVTMELTLAVTVIWGTFTRRKRDVLAASPERDGSTKKTVYGPPNGPVTFRSLPPRPGRARRAFWTFAAVAGSNPDAAGAFGFRLSATVVAPP